jgi:hypothetical protein
MVANMELLINILCDKTAKEDERDDAAMDLGTFNDDRALNALLQVGSNNKENETILDSCGESIAQILITREEFREDILNQLSNPAKQAAFSFIKEVKPDWIKICE